jgi:hypothetical protein
MRNLRKPPVVVDSETDHIAATASVENVDEASMLGHCVRFTSSREFLVSQ